MKTLALPWAEFALVIRDGGDVDAFSQEELAEAGAYRLQKRREEWMHARFAAKALARSRKICANLRDCRVTRPVLVIDGVPSAWHVSISHSHPYAGAAIDRAPIGIDVQVVRALSESAAHLFLSDEEIAAMQRCTLPHRLLHFWCAKEAAWKRRSGEFNTLRQLPLILRDEREDALVFDDAETIAIDDAIVALSRSTV
ncbi:MAG TPA: 4'-phosphopantetheinyl transferase superfamily protein [Thermoanaerobaculia bacterium]|nr:4'-phosphopantetheinyl transferase superfamily protein [Thermoanaerobaculia bacterium]